MQIHRYSLSWNSRPSCPSVAVYISYQKLNWITPPWFLYSQSRQERFNRFYEINFKMSIVRNGNITVRGDYEKKMVTSTASAGSPLIQQKTQEKIRDISEWNSRCARWALKLSAKTTTNPATYQRALVALDETRAKTNVQDEKHKHNSFSKKTSEMGTNQKHTKFITGVPHYFIFSSQMRKRCGNKQRTTKGMGKLCCNDGWFFLLKVSLTRALDKTIKQIYPTCCRDTCFRRTAFSV